MYLITLIYCGDVFVKFLRVEEILALKLTSKLMSSLYNDSVASRTHEFRSIFRRRQIFADAFAQWRRYVTLGCVLKEAAYNLESAKLVIRYLKGDVADAAASYAFSAWKKRYFQNVRPELAEVCGGRVSNALMWKIAVQRIFTRAYCCEFCSGERALRVAKFFSESCKQL
jgi:hypothetical protein